MDEENNERKEAKYNKIRMELREVTAARNNFRQSEEGRGQDG